VIARGTGSDRKTVGKYVAAAVAAGLRRRDPDRRVRLAGDALFQPLRVPRHRAAPGSHRLGGPEATWTFFGGVVRRLVADNLTPAVTRPDRYTPHINRVFLE